MNRRLFLIALAVIVPIAIFVAAKQIMIWRPVKIGALNGNIRRYMAHEIHAFDGYVVAGADSGSNGSFFIRFDLKTGAQQQLHDVRFSAENARYSFLSSSDRLELQLRKANKNTVIYRTSEKPPTPFTNAASATPDLLRVSSDENRVEMIYRSEYFRWNKSSGKLERDVKLWDAAHKNESSLRGNSWALTNDGETAIGFYERKIIWRSTRTGKLIRRVKLPKMPETNWVKAAPSGSYALFNDDWISAEGGFSRWRVVNARTGRIQWQFDLLLDQYHSPISSDETCIALPLPQRKIWQIRDLPTGKILRTLPLVPGAARGAFSPDGATLYSVANGVLYRQRAR